MDTKYVRLCGNALEGMMKEIESNELRNRVRKLLDLLNRPNYSDGYWHREVEEKWIAIAVMWDVRE